MIPTQLYGLCLIQCNMTRKRNKGSQIEKEELNLFLFTDQRVIYIENPKKYATLLKLMNAFSKILEHKINIQK